MDNTFITVTWNNENVIGQLIESIHKYENSSSIIVVDNNSDDHTVEIAEEYDYVTVISLKQNLGFSKANNIGFNIVKTEYVSFINPDTMLNSSIVSKLENKMKETNSGLIGVKLLNTDGTTQQSIFNFQTPMAIVIEQFRLGKVLPEVLKSKYAPYYSRHDKNRYVEWLVGAFYFTKSDYYRKVGGFSEDYFLYAEDMDLCYKYHLSKLDVYFDSELSLTHIGGASEEKSNSEKRIKLLTSFCIFAKKYGFEKNIKAFYYCYLIKKYIFFFNKQKRKQYENSLSLLKE